MPRDLLVRNERQLEVRASITSLEATMIKGVANGDMVQTLFDAKSPLGQAQATHLFSDGVYTRTLAIPAGTALTSYIWKRDRVCTVSKGKITYVNEFERRTVTAPFTAVFKAGSKQSGFAHTDTLWTTSVRTTCTTPESALDDVLIKTYAEYESYINMNKSLEVKGGE